MYDCPISMQTDGLELMIREEREKSIVRAVQKIGIDIDKESLIEALNHDRKRYEEAYQKGWDECKKHYEDKLARIIKEASDD